jgi:hypothetical protein
MPRKAVAILCQEAVGESLAELVAEAGISADAMRMQGAAAGRGRQRKPAMAVPCLGPGSTGHPLRNEGCGDQVRGRFGHSWPFLKHRRHARFLQ